MYVTPTAFARWSHAREAEVSSALRGGSSRASTASLPWLTPPPAVRAIPVVHAIHIPNDPPAPRLPDDWPKPPHLPREPVPEPDPEIDPPNDPRKPPKHEPDPKEPPQEDPPDPKEPPRHDPPPQAPPQIDPEIPGKEPPVHDPIIEPHDPPPRIDARAWSPLILGAASSLLRSALRPRLSPL